MLFDKVQHEGPYKDWHALKQFYEQLRRKDEDRQWIFRGQPKIYIINDYADREDKNELSPTLERSILHYGERLSNARKIEKKILHEFKRQFHNYGLNPPKTNDNCEWLAIMRHYGGPTRLLDFTYSFYVAAYFALTSSKDESVIWAIDSRWCSEKVNEMLGIDKKKQIGKDPNLFETHIYIDPDPQDDKEPFKYKPFIYPITPLRLNPRIAVQTGTFLCPRRIDRSFEGNLFYTIDEKGNGKVIRIEISNKDMRKEGIKDLHRMNINSASLFPGLGGFTESLNRYILFPELWEYVSEYKDD